MVRSARNAALAGLTALALVVSAVGPCHCLVNAKAGHRQAEEADAHPCCKRPAGVQAVIDGCCDSSPALVVASTDVPEVTPPSLQAGPAGPAAPVKPSEALPAVRTLAPPFLDRTTVLLI